MITNDGSFDEWMGDTYTAIDLIKNVGDATYNLRQFLSPSFSYVHDDERRAITYTYERELIKDLSNISAHAHAHSLGGITTYPSAQIATMSSNQVTSASINSIVITINQLLKTITSVQWVRKSGDGLTYISSGYKFGAQNGGVVRASMLFLPNNKILINDKIYSNETPDAFNNDIEGSDQNIRYMDLVAFREQFTQGLF